VAAELLNAAVEEVLADVTDEELLLETGDEELLLWSVELPETLMDWKDPVLSDQVYSPPGV